MFTSYPQTLCTDLAVMARCRKGLQAPARRHGFSLIELLVVVAIIGLLSAVTLPSLKGLNKSNAIKTTNRQLVDDLTLARTLAINHRSTVYMVFLTTVISDASLLGNLPASELERMVELIPGQLTAYALYTTRKAGDQPGQESPSFLSDWKYLPDGVFFRPDKFDIQRVNLVDPVQRAFPYTMVEKFFTTGDPIVPLPAIGFNAQGQLISGRDEILSFQEGSIFVPRDANGNPQVGPIDLVDKSGGDLHHVHINWLTGRARALIPQLD
jgi:prepilin-type N-terminal cleavage/methylation domain-containing protein